MTQFHPAVRTLLSLIFYIAVYYLLFGDIKSIGLLVLVIVVHELGHFLAMKAYGYSDVQMFFVPMFGAFVSGKPAHVDPGKKLVVLFSGPLPGIVLGVISAMIYSRSQQQIYHLLALMFILLNMFNLIPVTPMDGGQIIETLFPRSGRWIQSVFIMVSIVAIIYLVIAEESNILVVFLFFLIYRLVRIWRKTEEDPENKTELPGELSWKIKLMFLALWLAAIIIPLQTLYRIN